MLIILHHNIENAQNIIAKIKSENASLVKDFCIKKFLNNNKSKTINASDIVYILCNDNYLTIELIKKLASTKCKILNEEFYLNNYDKEKIQELLIKNGINAPKILKKYENINHKIVCKPKNHCLSVNIFNNINDAKMYLSDKNATDYYLEEYIVNSAEYKIYYANNRAFFYDNVKTVASNDLAKSLNKISNILKLDIFSADVIFDHDEFYFVDINPSSGLYMSKGARKELFNYAIYWPFVIKNKSRNNLDLL